MNKNLLALATAAHRSAGSTMELDYFAEDQYKGRKVRFPGNARRPAATGTLRFVSNQGFNGQVGTVRLANGEEFQYPLGELFLVGTR